MDYSFPELYGELGFVPLSDYDKIIASYVKKTSKKNDVKSIIQIGSFTTPGLSDIDIIVVLANNSSNLNWEDISLLETAKDLSGGEVVAHDVFVINESIARYAELYFYIDQQIVLYGNPIGGNMPNELVDEAKYLLNFDYSIFALEVLTKLLLLDKIPIRTMVLFISTMKHSLNLAAELQLIEPNKQEVLKSKIIALRENAMNNAFEVAEAKYLIEEFVKLIGDMLSIEGPHKVKLGSKPIKKIKKSPRVFLIQAESNLPFHESFFQSISKQQRRWLSKYFREIPVPKTVIPHILAYFDGKGQLLNDLYPFLKLKTKVKFEEIPNIDLRNQRRELALMHWSFLDDNMLTKTSGIAYIGLHKPIVVNNRLRALAFSILEFFFLRS